MLTGFIPDLSMAQKNSLSALLNQGRVLAIVETQAAKPAASGGGDTTSPPYILLGERSALEMSATESNLNDQASGNGISFTITTPTNSQLELNYPTNVDMSTADIEALEAVGV